MYKELFDFNAYVRSFDLSDDRNRLKVVHTMKVMEGMETIGNALSLSDHDLHLAKTIGLYHDIGRFEQLKRYDTFIDHQSVDHADLGYQILSKEHLLDHFSQEDRDLIELAIRLHNKYALPSSLSNREATFCRMIRDADKCDILRVFAKEDLQSTTGTRLEQIKYERVSPDIEQMILDHRCIVKEKRKTGLDIWMTFLGFFFDVNYPITLQLMLEQGYYMENFQKVTFVYAQKQVERLLEEVERFALQQIKK